MRKWASCLLLSMPLAAQAPVGWIQQGPLGSDMPGTGPWYGVGLWTADHHGPAVTLNDSLGLGNSLVGGGFHMEGGFRWGHWDMAAELLGNRDVTGHAYMTLYRSHIWYRGARGWQGGFEQEPLVWGYGLNGGYVLGEAARPFPRFRVESPMSDLHIFRVPLGQWGFQAFMGKLENNRELSPEIQDPSYRNRLIATQGDPQAPMISGYRVQATFGPLMEFYFNELVLWSGTLNGRGLTSGYNVGDYLTAMTGTKDLFAEAGTDYIAGGNPSVQQIKATSTTEIAWGFRLQLPIVARSINAEKTFVYIDRGSKGGYWPVKVFLKNPFKYGGRDLNRDYDSIILRPNLGILWNQPARYTAPSLWQPNDTVGIQVNWPRLRAGVEYSAIVDGLNSGFRPFTHGVYLTGFYYYGDPLGNSLGGELIATSAKVEADLTSRLAGSLTAVRGLRPFRDQIADWALDHPGVSPASKNRFTGLQSSLAWKAGEVTTVGGGASWQRQEAVDWIPGRTGNGFAWFTDVSFRWPPRHRSSWLNL
ncbi:MAG: hypothetical protein ABSH53_18140 [Holophaga sp.]